MSVVKLNTLNRYKEVTPSRRMIEAVEKNGLIVPLVLISSRDIHPYDRERYEAFCLIVEKLGEVGVDDIIVCDWEKLEDDEKEEYPL